MPKQIDNRVVEMEFNNKDFEKAVAVTLDSIDQLNKKLDDLNKVNTSGFDEIAQAANKIDFSKAASTLDELSDRFTTITGKIKSQLQDWVIDEIIKKPMQALEKTADSVMGIIVEKGKNRSKNLSQAKFQLEALGVAWEQVYKDMDYAVTGTAYGMDEAALAASQFAASNVKLGDGIGGMARSLRAISGVAAMTGRGYSEIAQIFTTVAGTGRAMNDELRRIAERGLNAKKAIADYLNTLGNASKVTQNDVEEMARKGQISFEIFSEAMMTAFGEHAAKANDLFTGALANTQAALGRIGERFATPIYEDLRQVLVKLIPVINDFKNNLDPVVNSVSKLTGAIRDLLIEMLEGIHGSFDDENKVLIDWFGEEIDLQEQLLGLFDKIAEVIDGITLSIKNGLGSDVGNILLNILTFVIDVLKSVKDAFLEVFGTPTRRDIEAVFMGLKLFTDKLKLSEEVLEKLKRTFTVVFAVVDIILKTLHSAYVVFIEPLIDAVGRAISEMLGFTGALGDELVKLDKTYNPFQPMLDTFLAIQAKVVPVTTKIKEMFKSIGKFAEKVTGISDIHSFFEKMDELAKNLHISDIFYGIAGAIGYAFDRLSAFIDLLSGSATFKEYLQSIKESSIILSWISDKIDAIKKTWNDLVSGQITLAQALGLDKLAEKFSWLNIIIDKFREHYGSIFTVEGSDKSDIAKNINKWGEALKKALLEMDLQEIFSIFATAVYTYFFSQLAKHKIKLVDTVKGIAADIKKISGSIAGSLNDMTKGVQEHKLVSIGKGLALIAGSIFLLALIPEAELERSLGAVTQLIFTLGLIFVVLGLVFKKYEIMQSRAEDAGILLLEDKSGKKGLGGFFSRLGDGISSLGEGIKASLTDLSKAPAMMIAFGAAIFILASSIYRLKDVDPDQLLAATIAIVVLMTTMAVVLTKMRTPDTTKLAGVFLAMAVAIDLITGAIAVLTLLFAKSDEFEVVGALSSVLLIMAAMSAVIGVLSTFSINPASVLAGAGAMMMIAAAIQMMIIPIIALTVLFSRSYEFEVVGALSSVILIMAAMAGVVVAFGVINSMFVAAAPGMLAGAGAMMMVAAALQMMMIPIIALTKMFEKSDEFEVVGALSAMILILATMTGVIAAMGLVGAIAPTAIGGMIAGAAAMVILALALSAMLIPLAGLAALQASGQYEAAFVALCDCLMLLAVASAVAIPLAPGLTMLSIVLLSVAGSIFLLGAAVALAGKGVFYFVSALGMLSLFDWQVIAENIAKNGTAIKQAILTLIGGALQAFIESADMAVEAALIMLLDVIEGIDAHSAELGFKLGHALMNIFAAAIAGLAGGLIDLVERAFGGEGGFSEFLFSNVFSKNKSKEAGESVGDGIFGGFKSAMSGLFGYNQDELVKTVNGNSIGEKAGEEAAEGFSGSFYGGIKGVSAGAGADYADEFYAEFDKGMNSPSSMSQIKDTMSNLTAGAGSAIEGDSTISDAIDSTYKNALNQGDATLDIQNGYSLKTYDQGKMMDIGTGKGLLESDYSIKAMDEKDNQLLSKHQSNWKQHSPSKVMEESGIYIDEGLAIGITESKASEEAIDKKSSGLVAMFTSIGSAINGSIKTDALGSLSDAIANIANSDALNDELNPVITPVLDLTNVSSGFSTLDSMFAAQRSVDLAGNASYLNDEGRNLTMQIQNDNRNGTNNNINALGYKLDRLGEALMNRQIVLDSGELVGGLVDPMDRSMGARAIMAQRA